MHSQGRLLLSNTAGIAGFELHALFRHPEIALPIVHRRAAVLPSPEGLQLSKGSTKKMFFDGLKCVGGNREAKTISSSFGCWNNITGEI